MLHISTDKTRTVEQGQHFVELTKLRGTNASDCDRLGYWCDKAHLKHFVLEVLEQFTTFELFNNILSGENGLSKPNKYKQALEIVNDAKSRDITISELISELKLKAGAN